MPGEDRIESIIDIPAVKAEYDQVVKMLENLVGAIKTAGNHDALKNPSIGLKELRTESEKSAKTVQELSTKILDVVKADEKLIAVTKLTLAGQAEQIRDNKILSGSFDVLIRQLAKNNMELSHFYSRRSELNQSFSEGKIKAEEFTESMAQVEKDIIAVRYANQELNRSLKNMTKEALSAEGSLNQLRAQLSQVQQAYDNLSDADKGAEIGQGMKKNIDALAASVKSQEEGTHRFGRNVGNYTGAIKILQQELADVSKKIDDFNKSGEKNESVLTALIEEQKLLQQIVDNQANGFASLNQELKENEKVLIRLKNEGKEDTEMYRQLFAEIAKTKDELQEFKQSLATRGSGELFLNGAIQSAQTLASIYGIAESATALFGKENEHLQKTMVKLQAIMTIVTGLESLQNALKKENAIITSLEVIKTNALAAAQKLYAFATAGATTATKALRVALISTGIGALLVLIGSAASAMTSFGDSMKDAGKDVKDLDKALESINEQFDLFNKNIDRNAKTEQARLKASYASDQALAKQEIRTLQQKTKDLDSQIEIKKRQIEQFDRDRLKMTAKEIEEGEKKVENLQKDISTNQQAREDLKNEIGIKRTEISKKNFEDYIKLQQYMILEQNILLNTEANNQRDIADNEKKTFDERINAAREFARIQQEIQANILRSQLLDPNLKNDPGKRNQLLVDAKAKQIEIERQGNREIERLNQERIDRMKAAQFEITKVTIEAQARANDIIVENEQNGYEVRLDAAYDAFDKRKDIIIAEREFELAQANLLPKEKEAIIKRHSDAINQLTEQYVRTQTQIYKDGETKAEENLQKSFDRRLNIIYKAQAIELVALQDFYGKGTISQTRYELEKLRIERKYRLQAYQEESKRLTDLVLKTKEQTAERAAAERELAENIKKMREETSADTEENESRRWALLTEKATTYSQVVFTVLTAINDLSSINFDRELARLEELQAANEKLKAVEIDRIEKSTLSEQDKAARIAVLNAKAQIQQEEIERKRRRIEIERARFEKASNIANIITGTAVAVVNALATKPTWLGIALAATVGAAGAIQLARAVATPLPKFAKGTQSSPEGPAIVGEEGTEMYITPSGKVGFTPNKATLTWLEKGTKIIPNDDLNQMMHASMLRQMARGIETGKLNSSDKKLDEVRDAIVWLAGEFHKGNRKAKAPTINLQDMSGWKAHIQKNVFD